MTFSDERAVVFLLGCYGLRGEWPLPTQLSAPGGLGVACIFGGPRNPEP